MAAETLTTSRNSNARWNLVWKLSNIQLELDLDGRRALDLRVSSSSSSSSHFIEKNTAKNDQQNTATVNQPKKKYEQKK